ncbi:DUF4844 domain-containing protein [Flavobacterium cerinum]|uniref:DUF4844 domain-containing protein n=1 Tax=Flavobacterium cerinum TaxID=2502784 RepID=A0ABY5IRU2_9FLAO|nr:DUF4844 domain-containing protein [Flavobacterium cerinum]UUC44166.1 DUF4844 domain-containing protein [Flavobacterium cerinum]
MPYRLVKEKLVIFRMERKFEVPMSIYYPGADNESVRKELSNILDHSIREVYSKVDQGIVTMELMSIVHKTLSKFDCFHLDEHDFVVVRQYLNRLILIVEWDCNADEVEHLI